MSLSVRSKKTADGCPPARTGPAGHIQWKMIRIRGMADHLFRPDRRTLLTGLGAALLGPAVPPAAVAAGASTVLRAKPALLPLRRGEPDTPIWSLGGGNLLFKQGDRPQIAFGNELPASMVLNWRGLDGISAAEPLISRRPTAPGNGDTIELPLRHAGTLLCDLAMLGDGATLPTRALPLIVTEREVTTADHDEVLLIEDWRLRADGTAIAPGTDPGDTVPTYTVNGQANWEIKLRTNERVRVRFINGLQRNVIAIKIEGYESWIMAIDGQPAEPFLARGGGLILAPGSRADVFIDATARPAGATSSILLHDGKAARPIGRLIASSEPPIRDALLPAARPLPSNGLPARLDLKAALRIDLTLGASATEWVAPAKFAATAPPAFRTKAGRTVVLGLTNRSEVTTVFHLHGHHFRLLDRLDDGWKPFWLDTLSIDAGQTQRVAFAAEFAGRWLIESVATDWAAPRLVRWYTVE
jgi:FtsP/CotA-like multicopper oxidase with cupredoxin domain